MGILNKLTNFVSEEYEEEEVDEMYDDGAPISKYESKKNSVMKNVPKVQMILFEPRSFDEAKDVADHLKQAHAAVVNLHKLSRDHAQRTLDFLTGVIVAIDGKIQKIGHNVVLCTPQNVNIDGEISLSPED